MHVQKLVCSKCGTEYVPADNPLLCKKRDSGRLDIIYDYDAISANLTRKAIESRKASDIWRYEELLPVDSKFAVRLGEGGTRLVRANRLGEKLEMRNLFLKDETRNPSGSFKDRAMAVGLAKAIELRKQDVVTASSGNAAASLAAYCAAAGIRCNAFVPAEASKAKIAQLLLYGATVHRCKQIREGADVTVQLMVEAVDQLGYYSCPSFGPFNPYQVEGPKTIAFEIYEQRDWSAVDFIFVPTGSGCLLTGIWKGVRDLKKLGFIESYPRLVAVQPAGNQALVKAINEGLQFSQIIPQPYPKSIASGLLDPFPWDGDAAIAGVKETRGAGVTVTDAEMLEAIKDLAGYQGMFAEPSGAAGLAGLKKMVQDGRVKNSDNVVVLITGTGLKDPDAVLGIYPEPLLVDPRSA